MRISYLWEFCSLVSLGNMSTTARRLNISQQALSKHLAALEKELGVRLFERSRGTHVLVLTSEGELFSKRAIEMLNLWNKVKNEMSCQKGKITKVLTDSSRRNIFYEAFARLKQREQELHPNIMVTWAPQSNDVSLSKLRESAVDLVLDPLSKNVDLAGIEQAFLFNDPAVLLIHKDDPFFKKKCLHVKDLKGMRLLTALRGDASVYGWVSHDICNLHGFSPKLESVPCESEEALFAEMLRPGIAALVPQSSSIQYQSILPFISIVELEGEGATFQMCAFYRKDSQRPDIMKVVDNLVSLYSQEGKNKT